MPSAKPRRLAGAMCAALGCLLATAAAASADPPFVDIGSPGGPLTKVAIGNDLSCQVQHTGDTSLEFYPSSVTPGDCGSFIVVGGTLYSPDFANHSTTATSNLNSPTPFTPVSQSGRTGSGTSADPFRVVTVGSAAGAVRLTETDTYVNGQESYRSDIQLQNTSGGPQSGTFYRAGDCFLQDTDNGFGFTQPGGGVGCSQNANNAPAGRIEEWVPITGGNAFTEDHYSDVWTKIGNKTPFANDCVHCGDSTDNGAGISWGYNLAPGASAVFSHFTTFSPTGRAGPPPPPPPPPVTGPAGNPLGLPSAKKCIDTRKFKFKLHHPAGTRIVDVVIKVNNKRTHLTKPNGSIDSLTLKKLPKKKFKVTITATQDSGAQLISTRKYKGCKKSKPHTRRGHK